MEETSYMLGPRELHYDLSAVVKRLTIQQLPFVPFQKFVQRGRRKCNAHSAKNDRGSLLTSFAHEHFVDKDEVKKGKVAEDQVVSLTKPEEVYDTETGNCFLVFSTIALLMEVTINAYYYSPYIATHINR